jgi:hypothetical protein
MTTTIPSTDDAPLLPRFTGASLYERWHRAAADLGRALSGTLPMPQYESQPAAEELPEGHSER